ncbi:MAG: ATP-binding cassette domain-containing protein [Burkholderiaceae bacterium]
MSTDRTLDAKPLIDVRQLHVRGEKDFRLTVPQLLVRPGELCALVGPNGAGKSTLLESVLGLAKPDAGVVRLFDLDLRTLVATDARRRELGAQLSSAVWNPSLKGREILAIHRAVYGSAAVEVLDRLGCAELEQRSYGRLSTGQRKRLDLAVALAHRPRVLLLDEPSAGLDDRFADAMWHCVTERRAAGAAIVVATHRGAEVAAADRLVWLQGGEVVADTRPLELLHTRLGKFAGTVLCADDDTAAVCESALNPIARRLERSGRRITAFGDDDLRHAVSMFADRSGIDGLALRRTDGDDLLALLSAGPLAREIR